MTPTATASTAQPALVDLPAPPVQLGPRFAPEVVRELAVDQRVCVRPQLRRVVDQQDGTETTVALACGSTREAVCPPCAQKARVLRMQQCQEGWHLDQEPERSAGPELNHDQDHDHAADDQAEDVEDGAGGPDGGGLEDYGFEDDGRRVRSTRRRDDAADLPRIPVEDRTVGRAYVTPDGREYRPSMFLTLTLPSYGAVRDGIPVNPEAYDYRRAALDALHFSKLVDRFWQNLRRCAGFKVQYFAAVEGQRRLAPHLHAAVRGAIPRATVRQVVKATYVQLWWPQHDQPVYDDPELLPVWDGHNYIDPATGEVLPSWDQALDYLQAGPAAKPAHVVRFGTQLDMAGIVAPSPDADRAVRYLTKYLTKAVAETHSDTAGVGYEAHVDRLHAQLRFLPCSTRCANWLRYGIQPDHAGPGMRPGWCPAKAHDRDHLGIGGRRVLVSRHWSGKTLRHHRADRATVVREALLTAGLVAPDIERMAAAITTSDGRPRYLWTDHRPDPTVYASVILAAICERQAWRAQYETAKAAAARSGAVAAVDSVSATGQPP